MKVFKAIFLNMVLLCSSADAMKSSTADGFMLIVNGTSTAGKTSIVGVLKEELKKLTDLEIVTVGIDDFVVPKAMEHIAWAYLFPPNWGTGVFDLVTHDSVAALALESHNELLDKAVEHYKNGKIVIVDTGVVNDYLANGYKLALRECDPIWIHVHCSPEKLVERVQKRNLTQGVTGQRSVTQTLHQYCGMYQKCENPSAEHTLFLDPSIFQESEQEEGFWERVKRIHDEMSNKIYDWQKAIQSGICPDSAQEIKVNMLKKFTPEYPQDLIAIENIIESGYYIDSSSLSIEECVKAILAFLV